MTINLKKAMLVFSTTLLTMQVLSTPIGMVYAETTDQEQVEVPPIKNYLEKEQASDPRFFFTRSRMRGMAEEPLQVTFFSDQEVSEARVILPEEATLLKNQLPTGISVEQGEQNYEWVVQAERAQNTFVLPLVFDKAGNYELSVEETTAQLEISEKEETSEEVPVEETESSDGGSAGQEELNEENEIEEDQNNEQSAEEVRDPISEAPQEQQTDEEETDEVSQVVEPAVFDGETAEVTTMAQFREAVANPAIGIISVQANLTEAATNVLTVDRPLLIQGNGYTLTFGNNGFYFQLAEGMEQNTFRIENATLTKVGVTPLVNATVESSKNWTVELEDITEVNANTMRLASLPEGSIHFTGGVSNFTRTTSTQTFIEAKEIIATNQAEVTISRGNAIVFFSPSTISTPKIVIEQEARVQVTTGSGVANTIDFRGESSELLLRTNGQLFVNTIGTTTHPTETTNNTIALTGSNPKISMQSESVLNVSSTSAKRGLHLSGVNPTIMVSDSDLTINSQTQTAINIAGNNSSFSFENSRGLVNSTTGQRLTVVGDDSIFTLINSAVEMNAGTGRGIYIGGLTPNVQSPQLYLDDHSALSIRNTAAGQSLILQGEDAVLSLNNQSELAITGAGTGTTENIQIGSNNDRPELSITERSKLSVTTTSGTGAATDTANNAIHLRGADPKATVIGGSVLEVSITSNARRGVYLNGDNPELLVTNSQFDVTTVSGQTLNLTGSDALFEANESELAIQSTNGQRMNLIGSNPVLNLKNSQLDMNATTGRGIYLQGATPQVLMENSQLLMTDTDASRGMILQGTDALLSLSNQSELAITGAGTGTTENIQIGNNNARPELSVTEGSKLSVTTTSGTAAATDTTNNAIHLRGADPKATVIGGSVLEVSITSNARRGVYLNGDNPELLVTNSQFDVTTVSGLTLNLTGSDALFEANESELAIHSTTGQRMNLIGSNPVLNLKNSQLDMNATTGRGIYLQGATPQVLMENSQLLMTDTGASRGMILQGTDALLSLSNQSELAITGAGTGTLENIQIGNNNARPELSVTEGSKLSVTTTSGTAAATDTANNAIHLRGTTPKLNIQDAILDVNIVSGAKRGLFVNGLSADILFVDSSIISSSAINAYAVQSMASDTGSALIKNTKVTIPSGNFAVMTGETLEINNSEINSARFFHHALNVVIKNNSYVKLHQDGSKSNLTGNGSPSEGVLGGHRNGQTFTISSGAIVDIKRTDGSNRNGLRMGLGNSTVSVEQGGKLYINNLGDGTPNDSQSSAPNAGVSFRNGDNNKFIVKDPGSEVSIMAENGAAITNSWNTTKFSMDLEVSNGGYFSAVSNTATTASGTFNVSTLNVNFDNPLFLDFKNLQSNGGVVFSTNSASTLTASNSDLALWQRLSDLDSDPTFNFRRLDYSFSGLNLSTLVSTSSPEQLNTSVIGNSGLSQFSRLSSNNGRWAIADELRVPTNADKKIHGRVSLPVGLADSRPAWDDEAIVTVEVESPSSESTQEYTAKTVGDTNEAPGISIYGEEPRGGLFEIDLDEPLEAGSRVRIIKVELTSGELTDGFEHQILTDTVEVFPIIPPTPAQFSSSIIAQDSAAIQGVTDNLDAEVTATHNGEPLNTESVSVDADGRFSLDLSEVSLEIDDEIQVFLRDAEGSAVAAGVVNPPETNNTRGNINPATELTFHDVTFEPATALIVGELGPVSPVDPLDPEIEVDPENKPELPEDQGFLSIDFISSFDFGSRSISAHEQIYHANPQRLLNEDGTVNENEERPNYVQISDRRPENERNGWELAVTQKEQFTSEEKKVLNGASISLSNQQVITAQGGAAPSLQSIPCELIPGNRRTLLKAQGNEGSGTWIYRFGDADTAGESVSLTVPKGSNPESTSYYTTLLWELSAVPNN
ncbi:WxL domain-containing protein [Enterococcus sp. DIV0840c]|uniref:WxL domain-containing protein n=1 Tax=Enterococcus sp. DIV0840c TaxID=2774772 RepID=UPI003D2B1240